MSRRPPRCSALLLFALRREDAWFRRSCWPVPPGTGFAVTGMGPDRAAAWAARALGGGWRVESVLSVGLCGGLRDGLTVGDIVTPAEVLGPDGRLWPCAGVLGPAAGRLVTTDRVIAGPAEKRELGRRTGADVVDMEATAVAEVCAAFGVPFAAVKVVSDPVDATLPPELGRVCPDGRVRAGRLLAACLRRPALVGE